MEAINEKISSSSPNPRQEVTGFIKIWFPSFLVFFANGLGTLAIRWWIAQVPGGSGVLGLTVGFADIVAIVVVVLFAGSIDRSDRPTVLNRIKLAMALGLGILVPIFLVPSINTWLVFAVAGTYLIMDCTLELYSAAIETVLADVAPTFWPSSRVAALMQTQGQIARLVAPLVGGGLIAVGLLWSVPSLGILGTCVTIGLVLSWGHVIRARHFIQPQTQTNGEGKKARLVLQRLFMDSFSAFEWIKNQPALVFMLVISVVLNLIVFPFYTLFPAFLLELHTPNQAIVFGLGSAAYGGGMLVTTASFMLFSHRPQKPIGFISVVVLGITAVLGIITVFPTPLTLIISMGILGSLFMIVVIVVGGIWLERTPSEVRVRVFSLRRLVGYTSIPLGTSLMGIAGAIIGFVLILRILLGLVLLTLAVAWVVLYLRRKISVQ